MFSLHFKHPVLPQLLSPGPHTPRYSLFGPLGFSWPLLQAFLQPYPLITPLPFPPISSLSHLNTTSSSAPSLSIKSSSAFHPHPKHPSPNPHNPPPLHLLSQTCLDPNKTPLPSQPPLLPLPLSPLQAPFSNLTQPSPILFPRPQQCHHNTNLGLSPSPSLPQRPEGSSSAPSPAEALLSPHSPGPPQSRMSSPPLTPFPALSIPSDPRPRFGPLFPSQTAIPSRPHVSPHRTAAVAIPAAASPPRLLATAGQSEGKRRCLTNHKTEKGCSASLPDQSESSSPTRSPGRDVLRLCNDGALRKKLLIPAASAVLRVPVGDKPPQNARLAPCGVRQS